MSDIENEYLDRCIKERSLAFEMLETFVEENSEIFCTYDELVGELNSATIILDSVLKDIKEVGNYGSYRRTFSAHKDVDTTQFMMVYGDIIRQLPQLVKAVDPKQVENAIKAGMLPEEAGRFIITNERWKTMNKPKLISTLSDAKGKTKTK